MRLCFGLLRPTALSGPEQAAPILLQSYAAVVVDIASMFLIVHSFSSAIAPRISAAVLCMRSNESRRVSLIAVVQLDIVAACTVFRSLLFVRGISRHHTGVGHVLHPFVENRAITEIHRAIRWKVQYDRRVLWVFRSSCILNYS